MSFCGPGFSLRTEDFGVYLSWEQTLYQKPRWCSILDAPDDNLILLLRRLLSLLSAISIRLGYRLSFLGSANIVW